MRGLILLLLLVPALSAQSLDMRSTLDRSGNEIVTFDFHLPGMAGEAVDLIIYPDAQVISVKDRSGFDLPYRTSSDGGDTLIRATVPYDRLVFRINTAMSTSKSGPLWSYEPIFSFSETMASSSISLSLPPGSRVVATDGTVSLSDDSLTVSWQREGALEQEQSLLLHYELSAQDEGAGWIFPIALTILAGALAAYVFHQRSRRPAKAQRAPSPEREAIIESSPLFKSLDETDRKIIREIHLQGGRTTQAHLHLNTHLPKVTLSRRLESLQNRGLIERSRKGIRNVVSLSCLFDG